MSEWAQWLHRPPKEPQSCCLVWRLQRISNCINLHWPLNGRVPPNWLRRCCSTDSFYWCLMMFNTDWTMQERWGRSTTTVPSMFIHTLVLRFMEYKGSELLWHASLLIPHHHLLFTSHIVSVSFPANGTWCLRRGVKENVTLIVHENKICISCNAVDVCLVRSSIMIGTDEYLN